ncbi:hypothetical protein ABIA85_005944 [Bradyrhizobium sp. LA6.10]|uniref:hypothetical protein n=1 Tax=Bradyrhizobium sp. LA6.10 TaxID=3156318 RepID=UPI003396D1BB
MSIPHETSEWDTSNLPSDRRDYLDSGMSFEKISDLVVAEHKILKAWTKPSENVYAEARQAIFRIKVSHSSTYDLFYNAPDGLRGRYWQSPDLGFLATRSLIDLLKPALLKFAVANPLQLEPKKKNVLEVSLDDVQISLEAPSAKVWVRERDDSTNSIIAGGPELIVQRWTENENDPRGKGPQWRQTPADGEIEIKGALIDSKGIEHIPEDKKDRSCQIHHYGFT